MFKQLSLRDHYNFDHKICYKYGLDVLNLIGNVITVFRVKLSILGLDHNETRLNLILVTELMVYLLQ